ncbi:MAG: LLM class flavin-dependent oxidoreductase [Candidatus Poribacteria bacterium]|jgi:hypothetical protein|nr:LLM class flavin-dependent oxidoreductase [Candidatus Poribacteria bacterium]MDP6998107.1 LLM class flavin-dependent oxidoreductase [Candidatus Poribacteria bacterium]
MKLGAFMIPIHPPEKERPLCFEEDIDFTIKADQLGFTEAWIGQHHTVAWEPIPSNDLFIANVLPPHQTDPPGKWGVDSTTTPPGQRGGTTGLSGSSFAGTNQLWLWSG